MLQIVMSLLVTLMAVGCGPRYVDYFPYHDDGRPKPKVVIVPVFNSCEDVVPWDVSKELTAGMRYEIMNNGELFLFSQEEVNSTLAKMGGVDFFTKESVFAQNFCEADFVVLVEFMDQQNCNSYTVAGCPIPFSPCREVVLKTRVKVIDLRSRSPRIVQQEILSDTYLVTPECADIHGKFPETGTSAYQRSSIGKAHQRMVSNLVTRMERVIKCSY
jgi:hypothetical protein